MKAVFILFVMFSIFGGIAWFISEDMQKRDFEAERIEMAKESPGIANLREQLERQERLERQQKTNTIPLPISHQTPQKAPRSNDRLHGAPR